MNEAVRAGLSPLLEPLVLRGRTLRNRIVSTAHAPGYAEGGMPLDRYQAYHEEKARGEFIMVCCSRAKSPMLTLDL